MRDRIIDLQRRTVTRDPNFGGEIVSWADLGQVWGKLIPVSASERYVRGSNRTQVTRLANLTILPRDDVDETSRVVIDSRIWQIVGLRKNSRRETTLEIEFTGETVTSTVTTTQRQAPHRKPPTTKPGVAFL